MRILVNREGERGREGKGRIGKRYDERERIRRDGKAKRNRGEEDSRY